MSKRSFVANGANVKQKDTLVFSGTWQAADTVTLTIDNVTLVVTVGTVTAAADVALLVYEAFTGATTFTDATSTMVPQQGGTSIPQMNEIDVSRSSATLTFTSKTAGVSFTMTASRTTGATGAISYTAGVVAATGKSFFSQQDNWSANTVPVDGDDIVFEQSAQNCSEGLSPAIQPGEVQHHMTYTGFIGRPNTNANNAAQPYSDYRTTHLTFDDNSTVGVYKLGMGTGLGATGIRLNVGAGQSTFLVQNSRAAANGIPNILLKGTHASNSLTNLNGSVGVGFYAGDSTTLATLINGQQEGGNANTVCGPDVTLTGCTVKLINGMLTTRSAISAVNIHGGVWLHEKGNVTTLNQYKTSTIKIRAAAALTIGTGYINSRLDLSESVATITFTNCEFGPNADVYAPNGNIVFTNPYTEEAGFSYKRKLNFGTGRTYALT